MKSPLVVVVDDDRWMAQVHARRLVGAGFRVEVAHDPFDAMAIIDGLQPTAVVLDVLLPGSNGLALIHELQSHSDLSKIPIILCTSTASNIPKDGLRGYGVRKVLDKQTMGREDVVMAVKELV